MNTPHLEINTKSLIDDPADAQYNRFIELNLLRNTTKQQTESLLEDTMKGACQASTYLKPAETMPASNDTLSSRTLLRDVFIKNSSLFGAMMVIYFIIASLSAVLTITIGHVIAHHFDYTDIPSVVQFVLLLASLSVGVGILSVIRTAMFARYEVSIISHVQTIIMKRIFNLPMSFFERYATGDLCHRVLMIEPLARISGQNQIGILLSFVFSLVSFLTMFYFTWKLTLTTLVIVSLYLAISIMNIKKQLPHIGAYISNLGDTAAFTFHMNSGMSRIKVFCSDVFAEAAWAGLYSNGRQKLSHIYRLGVWRFTITNTILLFTLMVVFFLATQWERNQLPLEHFIIFYTAFILLMSALVSFSMQLSEIAFTICAFRRLKPILETPTEHNSTQNNKIKLLGAISISNVQFHYPDSKLLILDGLSCSIAEGEHIAIVGLSGAGKSTLLKLLIGFYFPQQGQILFDGKRSQDINLSVLRKQIGVVFQDSKLMTGTLLTNIIDEDAGMTEDDAWHAAELVGLKDFIASLPMKMHTMVTQHVNVLSGGQKQLIIIARALVGKPRLLLLDEATNSLDPVAQQHIAKVIRSLPITCVSVAHRLSTIQAADRILVLDQGRIIEEGSYQHLLQFKGLFYQLTQQQAISFVNLTVTQKLQSKRQENATIQA